jgi:MFS family permease
VAETQARDLIAALDEASLSRFHLRAVLVSGMGFFTDAYDLFVIGIASALITKDWDLSSGHLALLNSTMLFAAFVGATVLGRFADLGGRKRVYWLVAVIMIVAALGSALAPSFWVLIGFRFLLGFGVGGDYPVSAVLMSEYANRKDRGKLVGMVFGTQALGLIVGPLVALALLGAGLGDDLVWRILLGLGAVPAAAVIYLRRKMPESPRYQVQVRGQAHQAASRCLCSPAARSTGTGPARPAGAGPPHPGTGWACGRS